VVIVAATELTIKWNHIQGVNSLASAGQTIPFAIGIALFIRIWYVYLFKEPDPDYRKEGKGDSDDGSWSPASSKDAPELSETESWSPGGTRDFPEILRIVAAPPPARQRGRRMR
jgi:hypothetical protein